MIKPLRKIKFIYRSGKALISEAEGLKLKFSAGRIIKHDTARD